MRVQMKRSSVKSEPAHKPRDQQERHRGQDDMTNRVAKDAVEKLLDVWRHEGDWSHAGVAAL